MRLRIIPSAAADIERTLGHYRTIDRELVSRFRRALNSRLEAIERAPQLFPAAQGYRRALLRTFPYAIYFRTRDDGIFILLVIHLARRPQLAASLLRKRSKTT